jgi:hypothetical protein
VPVGHTLPVGEHTTGGLRAALEHVADQAAGGQQVVLVGPPSELVHEDAQPQRAVGAAARDDDVGTLAQRRGDGQCAKIGVGREQPLGRRLARDPFAHPLLAQRGRLRHEVVARDDGHLQRQSQVAADGVQRTLGSLRVHAARVADHLDTASGDLGQVRLEVAHEVGRIARFGVLEPRTRQQRHRDLGQVIHHEVVDLAAEQLADGHRAVAPGARGAADTDDTLTHGDLPVLAPR